MHYSIISVEPIYAKADRAAGVQQHMMDIREIKNDISATIARAARAVKSERRGAGGRRSASREVLKFLSVPKGALL